MPWRSMAMTRVRRRSFAEPLVHGGAALAMAKFEHRESIGTLKKPRGTVALGATTAWTICTNRAGVCIFRPTLVCFTELSDMFLFQSAMLELFLTSGRLDVLFVSRVLPRECEGTLEYVSKPPSLPLAREKVGVRKYGAI